MSSLLSKELSRREVFWFYLFAVSVFVFPIVQVDYLFYDDNQRALLLIESNWRNEGRILIEFFYRALSFTSETPNLFPLAYLFAVPSAAFGLRALAYHYFLQCKLTDCLVLLPLFYSPFSLGIFIYQYDGPAVMIGISAVIYSVAYESGRSSLKLWIPALLIVVGLAINQLTFNILLGLYCVEAAYAISRGLPFDQVMRSTYLRAEHVIMALVMYGITVYPLMSDERIPFVPIDAHWLTEIMTRLHTVIDRIALLVNPGNQWLCVTLIITAALGYLFAVPGILKRAIPSSQKAVLLSLYFMAIPLLVMAVPGFTLLLKIFDPAARVLIGLSSLLMGVMLFAHSLLGRVSGAARYVLIVPVLCMLSFSFMFGRVLLTQKKLEDSVLHSLAYDINSRVELREINYLYLVPPESAQKWLPASADTFREVPALSYVLNRNVLFIPEQLPAVGIENVRGLPSTVFNALNEKTKVVDNRFYDIYQGEGGGYIQLKNVTTYQPERSGQ